MKVIFKFGGYERPTMAALFRSRYALGVTLIAAVLGFVFVLSSIATSASATGLNQGIVVPELARRDLPVVLDGRVLSHAQVGNRVFVGGQFAQVRTVEGDILDQANIFAYDVNTGQVDLNFLPEVSGFVRTLEPTADGTGLYVGGTFTRWDDSFPIRVAKLDARGNLDLDFTPRASAQVHGIVELGDSVYLTGNFLDLSGLAVTGLGKVDRITGEVDTSFAPVISDLTAGPQIGRSIEALPDGSSFFVLHFGRSVDGVTREAVAKFDIDGAGTPSLSGWNVPWTAQEGRRNCLESLRDLEISPDGSFLVVGGQGADNPPNCDSVLRYPTAGNATVNFDWSARFYSSIFSLAVSDVAIYVGGHFCAAPANPIAPGGVSSDFTGTANGCGVNDPLDPRNPSVRDPENAVFRQQLAALNPTTGQALPWQPGTNANVGVLDLTLTERGLLAGQDVDRFSTFLVGRSGFFDLSPPGPDEIAPELSQLSPRDEATPLAVSEISGIAFDDRRIQRVNIQVRNLDTNQFLQANGSFANGLENLSPPTSFSGLGSVTWTLDTPDLAPGTYQVRGFAVDNFGNTGEVQVSTFVIPSAPTCNAFLNADGNPQLGLNNFNADGIESVVIRRDNSFLTELDSPIVGFIDEGVAPGDYTYEVRWFPNGVLTDVPCTGTVTVPPPVTATLTCSVALNGDDDPVLTWNQIPGVSNYVVRDGNTFISTVTNGSTFTQTNAAPGDYNYVIRTRQAGAVIDTTCTPSPITVPNNNAGGGGGVPGNLTCTATVNNGNVVLVWDEVPNENSYQVRVNGNFIATVGNADPFTHTSPGTGDLNYEIRFRTAGVITDIPCTPTVTVDNGGGDNGGGDNGGGVGAGECVVTASGNGILLTWSNEPGNEVIRNNGGWVTTPAAGTTSYTGPGDVNDGWLIRRSGNDEVCSVDNGGGGGGGPVVPVTPACTATVVNGNVVLVWDAIAGDPAYQARVNGSWIATVNNATTFTHTSPGAGDLDYEIRYRTGGAVFDLACTPTVNA